MTETPDFQKNKIAIIVLAAGESNRMRQPKQLLKFRGKTLLRRAAETALESNCEIVCVVLGAHFEKSKPEISDLPIEIAVSENWRDGMSSSLKAGLEKLRETEREFSGALIMLCDQPFVDADLLNRLIETFTARKSLIAACEYAGTIGVPAIFSRRLFDEILNLSADGGAKGLIKKYKNEVEKIVAPEAAFDVDTPADYENLKQNHKF
jgi:molybdenum cofactor cytidylyltransferase